MRLLTLVACWLTLVHALRAESATLILDGETWSLRPIAREAFADERWRERWVTEGTMDIAVAAGRLTARGATGTSTATIWLRQPLPANVLIDLTCGSELPAENNAANLNLIVHATEADGAPYRFGRSGRYAEYHQIPNYIFTLTGGIRPGWARARRNPGFHLLHEETSTRTEVGAAYRIRMLITDGRVRYWRDGRLVHDVRDPQPLPGGHFALRSWRSRVWWSDLRFHAPTRVAE